MHANVPVDAKLSDTTSLACSQACNPQLSNGESQVFRRHLSRYIPPRSALLLLVKWCCHQSIPLSKPESSASYPISFSPSQLCPFYPENIYTHHDFTFWTLVILSSYTFHSSFSFLEEFSSSSCYIQGFAYSLCSSWM